MNLKRVSAMHKSRLNIAHILPWPAVGGTEHATLRVAQAVDGDFHGKIFHLNGATELKALFAGAGFETITYEPATPSYRHAGRFLRDSYALAREFKRHEINVVHCSDVLAAYQAAVAGRMAKLPVICHVRNRYDDIPRREANFLRAVNRFIFVSRDTWKRFAHHVPAHRAEVIYDGISIRSQSRTAKQVKHAVLAEFGIPQDSRIVGMVARVSRQKDYETLVKAAAQIVSAHPETRFLIVGDNSLTEEHRNHYRHVRQMLIENGVENFFCFTGFREDVARMISAMDIFVLSTHFEGLPLVVLEAMAQARPVVATAVDGIPEIVHHEDTGLLYQHGDHDGLAQHLISLLNSSDRAATLGQAGCDLVARNFTTERFAANLKNLYRALMHTSKGAAIRDQELKPAATS